MLLSEGQMSDYKGAALTIEALPEAEFMLGDRVMMPIGSALRLSHAASHRASLRPSSTRWRSRTTLSSTASLTTLRTRAADSRVRRIRACCDRCDHSD